jgi:hypothetical protein
MHQISSKWRKDPQTQEICTFCQNKKSIKRSLQGLQVDDLQSWNHWPRVENMKEEVLRNIGKEVITFVFSKETASENPKWKTDKKEDEEDEEPEIEVALEVGLKERPEAEEFDEEAVEVADTYEEDDNSEESPSEKKKATTTTRKTAPSKKRKQEVVADDSDDDCEADGGPDAESEDEDYDE